VHCIKIIREWIFEVRANIFVSCFCIALPSYSSGNLAPTLNVNGFQRAHALRLRRQQPTVWSLWHPTAINVLGSTPGGVGTMGTAAVSLGVTQEGVADLFKPDRGSYSTSVGRRIEQSSITAWLKRRHIGNVDANTATAEVASIKK